MITADEVIALVKGEMRGKLPAGDIDERTELNALGLSSLQIAEIVFTLEEKHDVEFDPARSADARTLGDLVRFGNEALGALND